MIWLVTLTAIEAAGVLAAWALCARAGQLDDAAGMGDEDETP